jgi:hypothetical protein
MPIEKEKCVHGYALGKRRRLAERECKQLHKECSKLTYDQENQSDEWKIHVAHDLNTLLGRAMYFLETDRDESDVAAAQATLRIVRRVEEFEGIRRASK